MILVAPIDGWVSALDEVPDPVFAGKMMGDGLAIDPTSATLRAPCDGEVIALPAARHAVTLRAGNGAEILLHVGCDTVALNGDGFQAHVTQGQSVRAGDALLTFDLDGVGSRVRSLITPVIVMDGFEIVRREDQRALAAGDFLMELRRSGRSAATEIERGPELRKSLRVPFEHGIHARPAAVLANALRGLTAEVSAHAHGRTANARSAVAWMELGVKRGDEIALVASGADASAALAALEAALGIGILRGVVASRGIAAGPAALIDIPLPPPHEKGEGIERERAELDGARGIVRAHLEKLHVGARGTAREVVEAHLSFIDDAELLEHAEAWLARGNSAGYAWSQAIAQSAKALQAVGDARVAERAGDLRDLAAQVLRALAGQSPVLDPPHGAILVGQELLPSQLVALPPGRIAGFCTAAGGPTSHVALIAASMNLPAVVAAGPQVLGIGEGTMLVLDAEEGVLRVRPDEAALTAAEEAIAKRKSQRVIARAAAHDECRLASGERIEIFANAGALADAQEAVAQGAEGCGLLRTELLFLDRDSAPGREEQTAMYQSIVRAFGGRPVVIRTLDAGSDKPLRYLSMPREENPALGMRGVRASLRNPELLRDQLHAILCVEPLDACRILLPMITGVSEVRRVREMLDALCAQLGRVAPPLGVMIETPASALLAGELAAVADFFSIGSNDLSQYTLAMDRTQAELAAQLTATHPAVLRLIRIGADAARAAGRPIAVCGGLASDPAAAPLLVGLGIDELSAVPAAIPELKATLRALRLDDCRAAAERALGAGGIS